jgi:5'-methylthioadenosine phosphorylase
MDGLRAAHPLPSASASRFARNAHKDQAMLAVIGGTGLYDLPDLAGVTETSVETPYGAPVSPIVQGTIGGVPIAFLARHGRGHQVNPSEIPFKANIYALKMIGATHLLSVNAVGSLQEHLPPRTAVVPDQIIDRTVGRARTFFDQGIVAHVGLADPYCDAFRRQVVAGARTAQDMVHDGGTYVCIEGPQFSTRAESNLYRQWGADIIGMTAMPEARLAREAGLCYASLALVTDYDVWHEHEDDVTIEIVQRVLSQNIETARTVIREIAAHGLPSCEQGCATAALSSLTTHPEHIEPTVRERVAFILGDANRRS